MADENTEETNNELSCMPNYIKENNVMLMDPNSTTSDLIQIIIERFNPNTSFYIVDIGRILRRVKLWHELFPTIDPFYAVKCNGSKKFANYLVYWE